MGLLCFQPKLMHKRVKEFNFKTLMVSSEQLHYDGPEGPQTWGGLCNTGKSQSPIDIVRRDAAAHQFPGLCKLHVEYNSDTQATVTHSGSHLQLTVSTS